MTILETLRKKILEVTSDIIPGNNRFALLDYPDYDNIGDSAIYVGENRLFVKHGIKPDYIQSIAHHSWTEMEQAIGDGPILIQGGGNFGDLWPTFNSFHEEVLERYPDRRVVQLPQTIYYKDPANAKRMAELCARHSNFVLLVRDFPSLEFAKANFKADIRLCPDSAFMMDHLKRKPPTHEILLHLREDQESTGGHDWQKYTGFGNVLHTDWPKEYYSGGKLQKLTKFIKANLHDPKTLVFGDRMARRRNLLNMMADTRVERGVDLLSKGRVVITDRLHGHILCVILGIPHCVIDNSYGKVSAFAKAWNTFGEHSYLASSLDEAIGILKDRENLKLA